MASTSTHPAIATEPSSHDDRMEMATSPYHEQDDINLDDYDAMQDHSVDNSMLGDADFFTNDMDAIQDDQQNQYQDDDMLDEDYAEQLEQPEQQTADLNMEEQVGSPAEDDEILYDEDIPLPVSPKITGELIQRTDDSEVPEAPVEVVEDMFEDMEKAEQQPYTNIKTPTSQPPSAENDTKDDIKDDTEVEQAPGYSVDENGLEPSASTDIIDYAEPDAKNETGDTAAQEVSFDGVNLGHQTQASDVPQILATDDVAQVLDADEDGDEHVKDPDVQAEPEELPEEPSEVADVADASLRHANTVFHPVKVMYLEEEMSLFPPVEGDSATTFFLHDSDLASQSIDKLLAACREVLGESLGHEDELVLDVPTLGLHICEDSKFATQLSLAQVLEVYLMLSNNESRESVEPLYCNLSSRVCLSTQYTYLVDAAREGKTYSEIIADYVDTPEAEGEPYGHTEAHNEELPIEALEENFVEAEAQPAVGDGADGDVEQNDQVVPSLQNDNQLASDTEVVEHLKESLVDDVEEPTASTDMTAIQDDVDDVEEHPDFQPSHIDIAHAGASGELHDAIEKTDPEEHEEDVGSEPHNVVAEAPVQEQEFSELQSVEGALELGATSHDQASVEAEQDGGTIGEHESNLLEDDLYGNQDIDSSDVADGKFDVIAKPNGDADSHEAITSASVPDADAEASFLDKVVSDEEFDESSAKIPEADFLQVDADVHPHTPSKNGTAKRKALEEQDDLDFIELSTPEPKRTRSS